MSSTSRKYHISDPRHALWGFLKFAIMAILLLVVLAANASEFDRTEINAWIQWLVLASGIYGGMELWKKNTNKKPIEEDE